VSWLKQLPVCSADIRRKAAYTVHFEEIRMNQVQADITAHELATDDGVSTRCNMMGQFVDRDEESHYLLMELTRTQREALFGFRGSAMGLAHNHAWAYGDSRACKLCGHALETEQHLLLICTGLRVDRVILQQQYEWYIRRLGEDDKKWMSRIIGLNNKKQTRKGPYNTD
jgi:hypothetical protein